jgi:outer membrane protein insertion porin family/translocation and assembly module TamA
LRFFGGGASDVRGYDTRTIGHYIDCPVAPPEQDDPSVDCEPISEGGDIQWALSLEARFRVIGDLGLVAFLDMGDVFLPLTDEPLQPVTGQPTPDGERERFDLRRHHLSLGLGLRYKTPVGPMRFDVAGRLPGLRREHETPEEQDFLLFKAPVTLHFTLGESY